MRSDALAFPRGYSAEIIVEIDRLRARCAALAEIVRADHHPGRSSRTHKPLCICGAVRPCAAAKLAEEPTP